MFSRDLGKREWIRYEYTAMGLDRSHTVNESVSSNCDGQDPLFKHIV